MTPPEGTAGAVMDSSGSLNISDNTFALHANDAVPGVFGLFFYGPNMLNGSPFGDGFRCVGGQTFRLQGPIQVDGTGSVTRPIDFSAPPASGVTSA